MPLKKLYLVLNHTEVDGGFGDAIETAAPVVVFSNEEDAKAYVKKHNDPNTYDFTGVTHLCKDQINYVEIPFNDLNADKNGLDWELSDEYYLKRDEE